MFVPINFRIQIKIDILIARSPQILYFFPVHISRPINHRRAPNEVA